MKDRLALKMWLNIFMSLHYIERNSFGGNIMCVTGIINCYPTLLPCYPATLSIFEPYIAAGARGIRNVLAEFTCVFLSISDVVYIT